MTISQDTAIAFLKADDDADGLIASMLLGARSICEGYCNRKFYDDQETADADFTQALTDMAAAVTAETAALATYKQDYVTTRLIQQRYFTVFAGISQRMHGIVIDDSMDAAILMTLGHLYVNREDNIVSGNNAVQLPVGAQRILQPKLWIGDLVATNPYHPYDDCCWEGS